MELILPNQRQQMLENFSNDTLDHAPVVKLARPSDGAAWFLTAMDPENEDRVYGLCDLSGNHDFHMGFVSLTELETSTGVAGEDVQVIVDFKPLASIGVYAEVAYWPVRPVFEIGDLLAAYLRLFENAKLTGEPVREHMLDDDGSPMSFPFARALASIS